jgi:acetyltransferase-like isoleucine patch superfamily enzyme
MNQFRDNFRPNILDLLNTYYYKLRGVKIGKGSIIMFGAKIERNFICVEIAENVVIKSHARICACNDESSISIGGDTTIGFNTFIFASNKVSIGQNCLIAPFVYIVDSNHGIKKGHLINSQRNETAPIIIEDDVWLGQNVTILGGVTVATGTVVAAKALLNVSTNAYSIFGGIPAKLIGTRE